MCSVARAQTYSPNIAGVTVNTPLAPSQAIPTDSRSMFFDPSFQKWRPYVNTSEVLTYLNLAKYRTGGFDIIVNTGGVLSAGVITGGVNNIYYFKNGTSNSDLVLKSSVTSVNGQTGEVTAKNADSLKSFPLDTTIRRNNYVVTYDSTERKFYLSEKGAGTTYTQGTGIDITGSVIRALNESPLWNAVSLRGRSIATTAPNTNQALVWNGIQYAPSNITGIDTVYFSGEYFYVVGSGDTTRTLVTGLDLSVSSVNAEGQSGYNGSIPLVDMQPTSWITLENMQEAFETWTANATVHTDDFTLIGENTEASRVRVDTAEGRIATQTMLATAGGTYALSRTPGRDSIDLLRNGLVISTVKDSAASPGSGITSVTRDGTLINDGTGGSPLGVDTSAGKIATKTDIALIAPTYPTLIPGDGIDIGGTPDAPIITNTVHKITDTTLYVNGDTLKIGSSLGGYVIESVLTNNPGSIPSSSAVYNAIISSGSSELVQITVSALNVSVGLPTNKLYAITDIGKEGFFYYAATVADQSTDHGGTIIVTADLKQYKRIYGSLIDIRWFGGKPDAVITGLTQSGTDNRVPTNLSLAAARANEMVYVGAGNWYYDSTLVWGTGKANYLVIDGNVYTNGKTFLTVRENQVQHKFVSNGAIYSKTNLGSDDYTSWVNQTGLNATTGNNWASLTGTAIELINAHKGNYTINYIEGFGSAFRLLGKSVGDNGLQENRITFNQLRKNRVGILMQSDNGATYVDKNLFYGGRISADTAISADGNLAGPNKTGAFTANRFFNVTTELCNVGIVLNSDARFNKFIGCAVEGGPVTGVFGPTKVWFHNTARDNSFIGEEAATTSWFNGQVGTNTNLAGSSFITSLGATLGVVGIGGGSGRMTVIGGQALGFTARSNIPSYLDVITLGAGRSEDFRSNVFGYVKVDGKDRFLGYKGQFINVSAQSGDTINMPPNCNYVRYAHAQNKVLRIDSGDIKNTLSTFAEGFKVEFIGPGVPTFVRGDNNTVVVPSSVFTVAGAKYQVDYRTNAFISYRTDNSGGGGGSGSWTVVGSDQYTLGKIGVGINPSTYYSQIMTGASTATVGLAEFPTTSVFVTSPRNGTLDFNGKRLRFTADGVPQYMVTNYDSSTLYNKWWAGFPITLGYWSASGGAAGQFAKVNAAANAMEFAYSQGGTVTITGATYTVLPADQWVVCNAASGTVTVTLPAAATFPGRKITIRNINAGSTVSVSNGDPYTTDTIAAGSGAITYWSTGSAWLIESRF
jgi:hypothetical protein